MSVDGVRKSVECACACLLEVSLGRDLIVSIQGGWKSFGELCVETESYDSLISDL